MAESEYLEGLTFEYQESASPEVWHDISEYIVSDITGEYGLPGESPVDRNANTGSINFTLNNVDNIFTPNLVGSLPGWGKGAKLRITCLFDAETWVKFYGAVNDIDIDTKDYGTRQVRVTAVDWLNGASTYPLKSATILTNSNIATAVAAILAAMPTQPLEVEYQSGGDIFQTVFDTTKPNAKAITEFQKLAMSEVSYIYLKRSKTTGEKLIIETRATRNTSTLKLLPVSISKAGYALLETGGKKLIAQGGYHKLHQSTTFSFDNNMKDVQVLNGEYIFNDVTVDVYPRTVAAATSILFTLGTPVNANNSIKMLASETKIIKGSYKNSAGDPVMARPADMVTPVATTHWLANDAANGTGTNRTANLTVTASWDSVSGFTYTLVNGLAGVIYVTFLTVEGKVLRADQALEVNIQDSDSIGKYDYQSMKIDQNYQSNPTVGIDLAWAAIKRQRSPRTVAKKIFVLANQDYNSMTAFLSMDIGDLIKVIEDRSQLNGSYYITRIGFTITEGGLIDFWFEVQEANSYSTVYWIVNNNTDTMGYDPVRTHVGDLIVG